MTGVGSQFDNSSPFDSGYQLLPMTDMAFETYLGVNELYTGQITISPNPANGELYIDSEDYYETATLYDLQGRKLITDFGSNRMSVADLNNGVYLLVVAFEDSVWNERIIIQH